MEGGGLHEGYNGEMHKFTMWDDLEVYVKYAYVWVAPMAFHSQMMTRFERQRTGTTGRRLEAHSHISTEDIQEVMDRKAFPSRRIVITLEPYGFVLQKSYI